MKFAVRFGRIRWNGCGLPPRVRRSFSINYTSGILRAGISTGQEASFGNHRCGRREGEHSRSSTARRTRRWRRRRVCLRPSPTAAHARRGYHRTTRTAVFREGVVMPGWSECGCGSTRPSIASNPPLGTPDTSPYDVVPRSLGYGHLASPCLQQSSAGDVVKTQQWDGSRHHHRDSPAFRTMKLRRRPVDAITPFGWIGMNTDEDSHTAFITSRSFRKGRTRVGREGRSRCAHAKHAGEFKRRRRATRRTIAGIPARRPIRCRSTICRCDFPGPLPTISLERSASRRPLRSAIVNNSRGRVAGGVPVRRRSECRTRRQHRRWRITAVSTAAWSSAVKWRLIPFARTAGSRRLPPTGRSKMRRWRATSALRFADGRVVHIAASQRVDAGTARREPERRRRSPSSISRTASS